MECVVGVAGRGLLYGLREHHLELVKNVAFSPRALKYEQQECQLGHVTAAAPLVHPRASELKSASHGSPRQYIYKAFTKEKQCSVYRRGPAEGRGGGS